MSAPDVDTCGHGSEPSACSASAVAAECHDRPRLLRRAYRLELLTVGWNLVEGLIAITAAVGAGSVALLGFGIDSFVESASGSVLIWRLQAERRGDHTPTEIRVLDDRAHKLVAVTLFMLAAYVLLDGLTTLIARQQPEPSIVGIALTAVSIAVMMWLARAKRDAARRLQSRALEADAFQTTACWWLSIIVLAGIGMNALFGWWWADPLAAIGMAWFLVREGRNAWRGDDCCD